MGEQHVNRCQQDQLPVYYSLSFALLRALPGVSRFGFRPVCNSVFALGSFPCRLVFLRIHGSHAIKLLDRDFVLGPRVVVFMLNAPRVYECYSLLLLHYCWCHRGYGWGIAVEQRVDGYLRGRRCHSD